MKGKGTALRLSLACVMLLALGVNPAVCMQETNAASPATAAATPEHVLHLPVISSQSWPLSSALHVLPPIGGHGGDPAASDRSLGQVLSVDICGPGDGYHAAELLRRGFCGMQTWRFDAAAGTLRLAANCDPAWGDLPGWPWPEYGSTIQTADVDGDGSAELLGRAAAGMETWRFDAGMGHWQLIAAANPTFDNAWGWALPQYYSTIQTADIDGDGQAELLARAAAGIETYRFDLAARAWRMVAAANPAWNDTGNWDHPEYYSTIQAADIDGDGLAELLARAAVGMETWRFDAEMGQWQLVAAANPTFDDRWGWALPRYYSTIQTADIDGDGQAELLARATAGLETYRFNLAAGAWQMVAAANPAWNDTSGWAGPQYYETIQTGDIDGDGQDELLARGACGMEAWHFDAAAGAWLALGACNPPWSDAQGWDASRYYRTIQTADMDGDGKAELLGQGPAGIEAYRWDGTTRAWVSVLAEDEDAPCAFDAMWRLPCSDYRITLLTADVDGARPMAGCPRYSVELQDSVYRLDWQILPSDVGKAFDISFRVAGLEVGSVRYTPATAGSTAIQFRIDNHPRIRARALVQQGRSATQVAQALRDEFYWTAAGTAQFLFDEGLDAVAVGQALRDVFFILDAQRVARILRDAGFSGVDTGEMLKQAFNLDAASACWALRMAGFTSVKDHYLVLTKTYNLSDVFAVEDSLEDLGFAPAEVLELTARPAVERFAPVLGFDRDFRGLPMSAEAYFQNMLTPRIQGTNMYWASEALPPLYVFCRTRVCGREACENGMSNSDFKLLQHGQVPTYYSVVRDDQGKRLRIAYWWFYGWQTSCNDMDCTVDEDGGHHGDWEHVIVTTSEDRSIPEYVTYGFHGNWYTRRWGSFYTRDGVRPVAYVGKYAHGCYHNQDCSGWMAGTPSQCCDYADYRNPNANTWWYSGQNLVSLAGNSESWMLADRIGSKYQYLGQEYTIVSWHWGPPHRWCPLCPCGDNWWQWDWSTTAACGTHPTTDVLSWSMPSCHSWGCGGYRASCPYNCDYDHNQTWPWPN